MKDILFIIGGILITSIVVLLCFFSCCVASIADEYWEAVKEELEKEDEKH